MVMIRISCGIFPISRWFCNESYPWGIHDSFGVVDLVFTIGHGLRIPQKFSHLPVVLSIMWRTEIRAWCSSFVIGW